MIWLQLQHQLDYLADILMIYHAYTPSLLEFWHEELANHAECMLIINWKVCILLKGTIALNTKEFDIGCDGVNLIGSQPSV